MTYHWKTATLADVCIRIGDGSHYSPQSVEDGLPMASVKDMTPFGINLYSCRKISSDDFEKLVRQGCQPKVGDVLIAKDGATALDTVCEVKKPLKAVLLSSIAILRPDRDKVTTQYLRYYLDAEPTREYMKAAFTTGAAIPRVVLKDFKRAQVRYPKISLQRKITSILSAYDDLIENNLRRIKILEEMAQTLYREWFVKFRFPGHQKVKMVDSPMGKTPEGWEIIPFSELLSSTLGGGWGSEKPSTKESHEVGVIRGTDFNVVKLGDISQLPNRYISEKSFEQRRLLAGDILVENSINAKSRSSGNSISITNGFLQRLGKNIIGASFCRVFRPKDLQLSHLIQVHMKYLFKEGKMAFYQNVATNGIANFQTARFLSQEKIALPTQPELRKYGADMFELLNNSMLADKNYYLRQTRDLLLPKLISGELDVSELDITIPEANA